MSQPVLSIYTCQKKIQMREFVNNGSQKMMHNGGSDAKLKTGLSKSSPSATDGFVHALDVNGAGGLQTGSAIQ